MKMDGMTPMQTLQELAERVRREKIDVDKVLASQRESALDPAEHGYLPVEDELPPGWRVAETNPDGAKYLWRGGLSVIVSGSVEQDGKRWIHVSACRWGKGPSGKQRTKAPTYHDLRMVKEIFVGPDRKAVQVFPAKNEHVNLHDHVLHLFACMDEDPLPDFTRGLGTV